MLPSVVFLWLIFFFPYPCTGAGHSPCMPLCSSPSVPWGRNLKFRFVTDHLAVFKYNHKTPIFLFLLWYTSSCFQCLRFHAILWFQSVLYRLLPSLGCNILAILLPYTKGRSRYFLTRPNMSLPPLENIFWTHEATFTKIGSAEVATLRDMLTLPTQSFQNSAFKLFHAITTGL
jgi:hypothetical protein